MTDPTPLEQAREKLMRVGKIGLDWIEPMLTMSEARALLDATTPEPFQQRVDPWLLACFGEQIARDREERNHRFLEEALEVVQSLGCTRNEAHQLTDYVFDRPVGQSAQEVGGVMVTLAALCLACGLDMALCGEDELRRIWTKVETIRAKQAAKPKHSPLPAPTPEPEERDFIERAAAAEAAAGDPDITVGVPDPTPLEQARAERIRQLVEALTRIVDWESVSAAETFSEAAYTHIEAFLAGLAAPTPEPARISAEAALAAVDRVMQRARMWDLGHPQAMIQSLIDDIRSELRAIAAPPPEPARLSAEQVDDFARTLAVKLATFEPRSDDLTPTQTRFNMAKAEILRALAAPPQGTDNG